MVSVEDLTFFIIILVVVPHLYRHYIIHNHLTFTTVITTDTVTVHSRSISQDQISLLIIIIIIMINHHLFRLHIHHIQIF